MFGVTKFYIHLVKLPNCKWPADHRLLFSFSTDLIISCLNSIPDYFAVSYYWI